MRVAISLVRIAIAAALGLVVAGLVALAVWCWRDGHGDAAIVAAGCAILVALPPRWDPLVRWREAREDQERAAQPERST